MDLNSLLLFAVACLAINLIPGPDVIYIVSNTMKGKMISGLKAAMGLGVGYFVHTLAASLGLSAIILSSALAFSIVKWLGAAYLVYLGIQALISMWRGNNKIVVDDNSKPNGNVFFQGIVVSVLNPKVALFFLSFLPQFIDPLAGSTSIQLLTLGLIFSLLATLCNVLYASAGSWVFSRPNSQRYSRALEGISGVLLIGLASKVMTSDR
ncbi:MULTISPECIES: LysE family translocator [Shewanella]|uniref:Lysine exporter protein (LYSE/YGGA) n=2 Tax=Shewanella TaxID=22 RepID=A3D4Y2_SHEB5|nr:MULTISPECIES: LysE family translocator [Shewanella]ABN61795.1 Lysine exporter protein (LYSE/YGGA) [Shewanella baltica OS155]ACK46812.1 Lysine exporter protein (LYSE/YGGA) [Shewanella baltica OS223]AEH14144.1 Lysine exporter protein (LYSE/YGGA) [Shewanella baltica OS117]MCB2384582.1 LysE family translocator [Shewanella sp. SR1]MCS6203812.1 LysE family translocator [Shewanella baltica]